MRLKMRGDSLMQNELFQELNGGARPTSPLQFLIREVNHTTATNFYKKWHYLGEIDFIASVNYGAYFLNNIYGVISYGCPNAKKMRGLYDEKTQCGWWEIKRLAMDDNAPRNSESRFIRVSLKILRKFFIVRGLLTLADDGVGHVGTIYKASGFEYKGLSEIKSDYVLNGKKIQRGKVVGLGGEWIPRSRKHVFFLKFENAKNSIRVG